MSLAHKRRVRKLRTPKKPTPKRITFLTHDGNRNIRRTISLDKVLSNMNARLMLVRGPNKEAAKVLISSYKGHEAYALRENAPVYLYGVINTQGSSRFFSLDMEDGPSEISYKSVRDIIIMKKKR